MKVVSEHKNLHRLPSPQANVNPQRAKRFCGGSPVIEVVSFAFFVNSFKRTNAGEHCSPPHYALISLRLRVLSHDSLRSLTPADLQYGSVLLLYLLQGRSVCRQSLVVLCQGGLSSPAFSLQALHNVPLGFSLIRFCTALSLQGMRTSQSRRLCLRL